MKFSIYISKLFYLILIFSNCVQEFDPPSQGYENLLVVEAFLSNGDTPLEIKLSRSMPIDTSAFIPESGAQISLSDDAGELYNLAELQEPGIYVYNGLLNPQIGKSYQIHISTQNGNQYESSAVTMRKTPEMDSVSFRFEERASAGKAGVQIYVDTHDPNNNTWYYRWAWDATWIFQMPYDSYLLWEDGQIKLREYRINNCFKYDRSTSIDISTSKNLTEDQISDFPLLYVSTESDRLNLKYSLNVKQYALSEEAYNYWKELQKVTENLGTLFDPQPSIVKGNIYNVNDENEVVLGYFDASSVSEKRIFINYKDLPPTRFPNNFSHCTDSIVSPGQVPAMVDTNWWMVTETVNEAGFPAFLMSSLPCIDCRLYGSITVPDYWE